jgi:hypothetical protein
MTLRFITFALIAAVFAPLPARADACQARFSNAPCYLGAPNLKLARSFVDGAGGPGHTSTMTLLALLAGPRLADVQQAIVAKYGKDAFADFITASDFAMQDSAGTLGSMHLALPATGAPSPKDGKALFAALWSAGSYPKGAYDYEYMLDRMLGHPVHAHVMDDIDAKYGKKFDAYYHVIFNAFMQNVAGKPLSSSVPSGDERSDR